MDIVTEDMQSRRDRGGWWRQDEMEEEELLKGAGKTRRFILFEKNKSHCFGYYINWILGNTVHLLRIK